MITKLFCFFKKRKQRSGAQVADFVLDKVSRYYTHALQGHLVSMRAAIGGVEDYFPDLVKGYKMAVGCGLEGVPNIPEEHLNLIFPAIVNAQKEASSAKAFLKINALLLMDMSQKKLKKEWISLGKLLSKVISEFPYQNERQKKYFEFSSDANKIHVLADRKILEGVFFVLTSTLVRFIDRTNKEALVKIETFSEAKKNYLVFNVFGAEIDHGDIKKVFDKWECFNPHDLGVELYFCKKSMNGFGGDVRCVCKKNQTQFIFVFPTEGERR